MLYLYLAVIVAAIAGLVWYMSKQEEEIRQHKLIELEDFWGKLDEPPPPLFPPLPAVEPTRRASVKRSAKPAPAKKAAAKKAPAKKAPAKKVPAKKKSVTRRLKER